MRAEHSINVRMGLQSRESLRDPLLTRIIVCQTRILNAGVLLLAFVCVISCGSCSRVIKGDLFKDDVINLRRGPTRRYAQEAFSYRNKAVNLEQLLLADRHGHYRLFNIQSGTKLFCCPAIPSSSFGQIKGVCVGSRALLLQSSLVSFSSNTIFTGTSAPVRPPAHQASVHPADIVFPKTHLAHLVPVYQQSHDDYELHEAKASQPLASTSYQRLLFPSTSYLRGVPSMPNTILSSSLHALDNSHFPLSVTASPPASQSSLSFSRSFAPYVTHLPFIQSPHMSSLSPSSSAIQPSQSLADSAGPDLAYVQPISGRHLAIVPTSLPDESMPVQQIMESPPSLLHPVLPKKLSLISELDPVPPVSQLSKQGSEHLGFLQAYLSIATPSYFSSPGFLPKDLAVNFSSFVPGDNVPFNGSPLSNPQRTPAHSGSPVSFDLHSSGPAATERDTHVQTAASPHASVMRKVLMALTQNTQHPCKPPTRTSALPPTAPLLVAAPPSIQSYDMQYPEPSSQALHPSERLHSKRITSTLAPRHPLSVTVPPSVPSHGRLILEPSFQSSDPREKTFSTRVLRPLNAQSLAIHSSAIPYLQGPSGHKFESPETVSSKMHRASISSTQLLPVITPPPFEPHTWLHDIHHSTPGSVTLDSSNSFSNYSHPRPFNDPSPALPPVLHSRTSVLPAGTSGRKRQKQHPVTTPATVPISSNGNVASPVSSVPSSAPRERLRRHIRRHTTVAMPPMNKGKPGLAPSTTFHSHLHHQDVHGPVAASPRIAPSRSHWKKPTKAAAASPVTARSPPPHQDCATMSCTEPFTSSPLDSPCGCVLPMQVELELEVAPYAFFPLVSELAAEIAAGTYLKQSQVRIMGANANSQDQGKTYVNIDLVPLGEKFDNTTALLTYERFRKKKVIINETLFGDYRVIYVHYSGLPPSPPYAFSDGTRTGGPNRNIGGPGSEQPLGVDIRKRSEKLGGGTISAVALSSAITVIIFLGAVWFILLKYSNQSKPPPAVAPVFSSSVIKRSGAGFILSSSMASSASMSFASSMVTYTGSAKTFMLAELEKATDRFNLRNILGEGGFGRVYRGVLEDGTRLAVKVLTRDDQQGGREFIAEVEMLSRLHHRNLVKLLGICTEEHNRCLVYELIPNGSVESHLHGQDKANAPLDWDARMKIALGAARGLAYLHEDSNPRVIHRDFKASNILLEDDFTPKVSDFGLAKAASDERSEHISTRVMGTFGYVAPEYAMTGHLLVKSDVYSYGVVLLELLSGRKPVDMSQPPGQENLVTWARPLLTNKEGLEILVDPALGGRFSFDNMARVAAIASMCVQPEVSHRPFMGEVVQALKLVYNDSDASNGGGSGNYSQVGDSLCLDNDLKDDSDQAWWPSTKYVPDSTSFVTIDYDSGPLQAKELGTGKPFSASALLSYSGRFVRQPLGSFRRHSSPGPLRTNRSRISRYRGGGLMGGSKSEHSFMWRFDTGIDRDVHECWP